jgi:endonuclease/exonuclease/phosphatase family metal-dependent hydrolase
MKKVTFLQLVFLGLLISGCQDNTNDFLKSGSENELDGLQEKAMVLTGQFTALTYNVAGLLEPFSSGNPETNTPIIGQKVRPYSIVNVQEDFNYHAALYANDNHPYRTATSGGMAIGDGLNTMSNFPFTDFERIKWSNCNGTDCLTPKGFTIMRIRLQEGVYVDLYNAHPNAGSESADYTARRANISQLANYINANSAGNAVIVMGDFNCRYTRNEDNIRLLRTTAGCTDAWVQLIKGGIEPVQGSEALVCPGTDILNQFDCELVDKIFYRSNGFIQLTPDLFTYEDATFRDSNGNMLSDHRPVFARFNYSLESNRRFSDQFGGPHGANFNDVNSLPASPSPTIIGMRAGSRIDQVNITLSGGITLTHGGTGGTAKSLTLNSGEYVKSIQLCSGKYNNTTRIFYCKYTTSSGRTLAGGSTTSATVTYTAPAGWKIVGFHGRCGSNVDKLGVIYAPVN